MHLSDLDPTCPNPMEEDSRSVTPVRPSGEVQRTITSAKSKDQINVLVADDEDGSPRAGKDEQAWYAP
jgi:hypothetical protein